MRRLVLSVACLVPAVLLLTTGVASADNGPHGDYGPTTGACAACHRGHTGLGSSLLKSPATATDTSGFCYTCHSLGAGADTDVQAGLLFTTGRPLMGGGFQTVTMNADLKGSAVRPVTSSHMVTGGLNTVWGYGDISSDRKPGVTDVALPCTNCHNE